MTDSFPRSMVIFLEEKLKEREVTKIEEFEVFIDNLESWFMTHLTKFNIHKKQCVQNNQRKLENITAQSIFESLSKFDEDEMKHFILKNQVWIDHKKVGMEQTDRHREFDYKFEFNLDKLTLSNQMKLALDLADYIDKFH